MKRMALSLALAVVRLLTRLPYRWQMRMAWALAPLLARLAGKRAAIARANLALAFPELDGTAREALLRANLCSTAVSLWESLFAWFAPPARSRGIADIEGLAHLQAALAQGRGALLIHSHFTMIELGGRLLSEAIGQPMHQMVRRHNDAALEAVIDAARRSYCERTIEKKDVATLLRSLRAGHPVGYAPDQNFNTHAVFVPFFGRPAATLAVTGRLARWSGAPVLCCWIRRKPSGYGYVLRIDPPLTDFPSGDEVVDTARLMALLEAEVRAVPEQYLWAHRRYKTQPADRGLAYPDALLKPRHRGSSDSRGGTGAK